MPTALVPMSRLSTRRLWSLARAESTILLRNPPALMSALGLPLFMTFIYTMLQVGGLSSGMRLTTVLISSCLLFVVYYTMVSSLVARREQLVLKRLYAGEATPLEILLAPAFPLVVLLVIQVACGLGGSIALGAIPQHGWALLLAVVGGAATWTALAVVSASHTRTVESAQFTTMPLILVAMAASGFSFPLDTLPFPLEWLAHWLPMTPVVDLIIFAFTGTSPNGELLDDPLSVAGGILGMLAPLAAWCLGSMALARRVFRWDPRN